MKKYKATVRFSGFAPGEIIEIPDEHDIPESFFTEGYLVPLEEAPKKKTKKKVEKPEVSISFTGTGTTTTSNSANITYNNTNSSKSDKID